MVWFFCSIDSLTRFLIYYVEEGSMLAFCMSWCSWAYFCYSCYNSLYILRINTTLYISACFLTSWVSLSNLEVRSFFSPRILSYFSVSYLNSISSLKTRSLSAWYLDL